MPSGLPPDALPLSPVPLFPKVSFPEAPAPHPEGRFCGISATRGGFRGCSPLRREFLLEEDRQIDLSHEADSLRILAPGRGESLLFGDAPHFGLEQAAHREEGVAQLLLRELAEKIALVLVGIAAREQPVDGASVREPLLGLAAVVARGHVVGSERERLPQEDVELDFAVAQHVGIGRAPPFVLGEHVVHHPRAVLRGEVRDMQRDVQFAGHQFGENPVVAPRAVALERSRRVVPVHHEQPRHFMSLFLEEPGGHRRIDAARKSDHHVCHVIACRAVPRAARGAPCALRNLCVR